jgi:hypothetical protein
MIRNIVKNGALLAGLLAFGSSVNAAPIEIGMGVFSGSETVLDFEEFEGDVDVLTNELAGVGVLFNSIEVEPHQDYGSVFADIVEPFAGQNGLFQGLNVNGEQITFTSAVTRVGFNFGSNVDVNVPFLTFFEGLMTGSFNLVAPSNTMPFFGFEDVGGIDQVVFLQELNSGLVSQIDNLRFESEGVQVPVPPTIALLCLGLMALRLRRNS